MKTNIAIVKSKKFAIRIVNLCKYLNETKNERILSNQILRSGTSIGANLAESECSPTKKDFVNKVYISLKECNETIYWLGLLYETEYIQKSMYDSLKFDCLELKKILQSTTKTINIPIE